MWECTKCKNKNLPSRKVCNRCREVMPTHILQAMMAATKQAVVSRIWPDSFVVLHVGSQESKYA